VQNYERKAVITMLSKNHLSFVVVVFVFSLLFWHLLRLKKYVVGKDNMI